MGQTPKPTTTQGLPERRCEGQDRRAAPAVWQGFSGCWKGLHTHDLSPPRRVEPTYPRQPCPSWFALRRESIPSDREAVRGRRRRRATARR
jgi:hypothetical protein